MASTARTAAEKVEHFDSPEVLKRKIKELAQLCRASKHMIAFTGAGISTAAGVPDFRSGMNTVLETGPGKWERQANRSVKVGPKKKVDTAKAFPTYTHMALKTLLNGETGACVGGDGKPIKHGVKMQQLISQNTDGLHRRSGVASSQLCELHGNSNLEKCNATGGCGRQYLRDFRCRNPKNGVKVHVTGRLCDDPACRGKLRDTIINFGENLPEYELDCAEYHSKRADLCIALGSSLTVTPAADFPKDVALNKKRNGKLVIINLQSTPLDGVAHMRVNGKCDDVMRMLMQELNIEVPKWRLERKVAVTCETGIDKTWPTSSGNGKKERTVTVSGLNPDDGTPYHLFQSVDLVEKKNGKVCNGSTAPPFTVKVWEESVSKTMLNLKFM